MSLPSDPTKFLFDWVFGLIIVLTVSSTIARVVYSDWRKLVREQRLKDRLAAGYKTVNDLKALEKAL